MTAAGWQWWSSALLLLAGWQLPRRAAGASPWRLTAAWPLDLLLPLSLYCLVLAASARPFLAGLLTLAAGAGWARADRDKRRVLCEPIVFTDVFQSLDILRHPHLALPFPHKWPVALAALVTLGALAGLVALEPVAWHGHGWLLPLAIIAGYALWRLARTALPHLYAGLRRRLSGDPARDGAVHGALATLMLYGLFAAHERPQRRACATAVAQVPMRRPMPQRPILLVQNESFFDARRLHAALLPEGLPAWDRACREARQHGLFGVPSWGANTVRTECAVLTGMDETRLGFDRFNPYHQMIRQPWPTWISALRRQGYYTVCLHPFDRRFYARDQVMSHLGFDTFLGDEDFADVERINGYVTDAAATRRMLQLLDDHGDRLLLFVITMENHGPWRGVPTPEAAQIPASLPLQEGERAALGQYLRSVRNADLMIERLCAALRQRPNGGVLGFYGDHLPSFPGVFPRLGLHGVESDYFIWDAHRPGAGHAVALQAHDFGRSLLATVQGG